MLKAGGMTQVAEYFPSKREALSSNISTYEYEIIQKYSWTGGMAQVVCFASVKA
jgi:hypothetical protein